MLWSRSVRYQLLLSDAASLTTAELYLDGSRPQRLSSSTIGNRKMEQIGHVYMQQQPEAFSDPAAASDTDPCDDRPGSHSDFSAHFHLKLSLKTHFNANVTIFRNDLVKNRHNGP